MIDFVLEDNGQEPVRLAGQGFAPQVLAGDAHAGGARNPLPEIRHAQASFNDRRAALRHGNDWVGDDQFFAPAARCVGDEELNVQTDLGRGHFRPSGRRR